MTGTGAPPDAFRFVADVAFTLTGRGTTVVGRIESGVVHVGDLLRLERGGRVANFACEGVSGVRMSEWRPGEPQTVALLVPALNKADVQQGDVFLGHEE